MCYIITIFSLLCCLFLPAPARGDARDSAETQSGTWKSGSGITDMSQNAPLLAQAGETAAPETNAPAPRKTDGQSGEKRGQEKPPQQKEKKPTPNDFAPSEEIDADKAVDFPADI